MEQMMDMIVGEAALNRVAPLFANWEETLIWTALQGMMGRVWTAGAYDGNQPKVACCQTGDFVFPAGDASCPEAEMLLKSLRTHLGDRFAILTPQNDAWSEQIRQVFGDQVKAGERYAICKDAHAFDRVHLSSLAETLPAGVTLVPIAGKVYDQVMAEGWSCDFCSQFDGKEDFANRGLGIAALYQEQVIGGASSYIRYREGIEIEVDTRADWRRRGIATACCARLILTCLERGWYPSWDAANRESVALAEKLGYREKGAYPVWFVNS